MARNACRRCLLRELAGEDAKKIEAYKGAIKACDRAAEALYESRLSVCMACDKLNAGTCGACGCYVELRAAASAAHCPKKKW